MRKEKLKKFNHYVCSLLPHESAYLKRILNSTDPERIQIMDLIHFNVSNIHQFTSFNSELDKRKYSKMLAWMQSALDKIDVDKNLKWITETHELILLDLISPERDNRIIRTLNNYLPHDYFFMRFYEMLVEYRHYLLIRMRYNSHQKVNDYLEKYHFDYQQSKLVYEQLHQATADIIGTAGNMQKEAIHWKKWLHKNFKNENLDGLNRYMAAIRFIFICLRYTDLDGLESILTDLNTFFSNGNNYSKRLLVNYYDNMLVFYDKKGNYNQAKYFGYLSIKNDHPDALIYRNNLINFLIKNEAFDEALNVIEDADFRIKSTKNFHSVIGFVSNHIRCLTKVGRIKEAINKGRVFLNAYDRSILKYRWHRFFAAFLGALLSYGLYDDIVRYTEKYKIHELEESQFTEGQHAQKILNIYYQIALLKKQLISVDTFNHRINLHLDSRKYILYDTSLLDMISNIS